MCMACGHPQAPGHWTEAGAATPGERLRARMQAAAALNRLLRPFGLTVHDTHPVPGYRLATQSGAVELVPDLDALWIAAARRVGRPIDPLDPRFLDG
jgi:hypothetical protein